MPNWRALATAVSGMAVCIGFGRFSLGLLLPDMKADLGLSYSVAGLLASLNLVAYFVGVLTVPVLARRFSYIRLVQAGLGAAAGGMLLLAIPGPAALVPLALVATGIAGALGWVAGPAIGAAIGRAGRHGRVMGVIGTANGIGIITSSLIALSLARDDGGIPWRWVWLAQAAIGFLTLLLALGTPPLADPGPAPARGRARLRGMKLAYAFFGIGYAWFSTFYIASLSAGLGLPAAGLWSVVGAGSLVGSLLFGIWSDRWGRRPVLMVSQLVAATSCLSMALLRQTLAGAVVAGLLFGSVLTGMASLIPATLAELGGAASVGRDFAALTLVFAAVQSVAPVAGGLLVDHAPGGFGTLYAAAGAAFLAAAAGFGRFARPPVAPAPVTPS